MRAPRVLTPAAVLVFLTACGGGGSAVTATITGISPQQPVTGQPASFSGSASGPSGATLSYSWSFGDGGSAAGASVTHTYATRGSYPVTLTADDGQGNSGSASRSITVNAPPTAPAIGVSPSAPKPGDLVTLTASSTDPQGNALTYSWTFGDGTAGSGASVTHTFAEGVYTVQVTAADALLSLSASAQQTLTVTYPPPSAPQISADASTHYVGQLFSLSAAATDPSGLALTYTWTFGDGGTATGATVTHAYTATGTYTVTATATNSQGKSASSPLSAQVLAASTPAATANQFVPLCSGALCAAVDATTYAGTGVGAWIYYNTTASPATLTIRLTGVSATDRVSLIFSNGQSTDAASLPSTGTLVTGSAAQAAHRVADRMALLRRTETAAHAGLLIRNHDRAAQLIALRHAAARSSLLRQHAAARPHAAPAVGTTRIWYDTFDQVPGVPYTTQLAASCLLPTGRNALFWVDPAVKTTDGVTDADLTQLEDMYCGDAGGYAQLTGLLGDVWVPGAANYTAYVIQDTPTLQDVNIIIPAVPDSTPWGGYFSSENDLLQSYDSGSNQALAFFINGRGLHQSLLYYASALLHESTHMINYYQRSIVSGYVHDVWLEETSAMMTEDILGPALLGGYTSTPGRLDDYVSAGGALSYVNWSQLQAGDYGLGGSFGAFLNRRYGLSIYQGLVTSCADGGTQPSYLCMDALITGNGGNGFADDFARFGATIFGAVPPSGAPFGLGYPATLAGAYTLPGFTVPAASKPASLNGAYAATSQTYQLDTAGAGYERDQVVVPAGTSLIVIVQPAN